MQNKQTTLIAPVEALTQQVAGSFSTTPIEVGFVRTVDHNNNSSKLLAEFPSVSNASALTSTFASTLNTSSILDGIDGIDEKHQINTHNINAHNISSQQAFIFSHRQGFRINNYNLMVRFEDGNQISEIPRIYPLPNAPSWFLGMSNINGQTIPVFNLKEYFGITKYSEDNQRIEDDKITVAKKTPMLFVIQQGDNATGIIIDGLLERLDIDDSKIQRNISLPNRLQHCINNTYLLNKELWYDLNCLDFLDEMEKQVAS